jgi:hypothetical protein
MPRRSCAHGDDLIVISRTQGRLAGEERVVLATSAGEAARGLWSPRPSEAGLRPWADLDVTDPGVLPALARRLGPGAALMVAYGAGDDTERALRRGVPPAATPLGLALVAAGCRWFKDWYFAEGGREGSAKLQGNLPPDTAHRRRAERRLRSELGAFLADPGGDEASRARARTALDLLGPEAPEKP